uniref:Uncharacterized protein n=1 Tax=Heliothis virescens TaxID=7102 RepID=A0A2A4JSH0_HELVI
MTLKNVICYKFYISDDSRPRRIPRPFPSTEAAGRAWRSQPTAADAADPADPSDLSAADMDALISYSQPAHADDLLLGTPADGAAALSLGRRMTRVWLRAAGRRAGADALAAACARAATPAAACTRACWPWSAAPSCACAPRRCAAATRSRCWSSGARAAAAWSSSAATWSCATALRPLHAPEAAALRLVTLHRLFVII